MRLARVAPSRLDTTTIDLVVSRPSTRGIWRPVAVPVFMGIAIEIAELAGDTAGETVVEILGSTTMSFAATGLAVDMWAISTLFTTRRRAGVEHAYPYPLVGLVLHIVLVVVLVNVLEPEGFWKAVSVMVLGLAVVLCLGVMYVVQWAVWRYIEEPARAN